MKRNKTMKKNNRRAGKSNASGNSSSDSMYPIFDTTGFQMDSYSGLYIDPATGLDLDPSSGYPIDPSSNMPFDPATGMSMGPAVAQVAQKDASTGQTVNSSGTPVTTFMDPNSGMPVTVPVASDSTIPSASTSAASVPMSGGQPVGPGNTTGTYPILNTTGLTIDKVTQLPIDPATGLPIDPQSGYPINPKTNNPYNPLTGQDIPESAIGVTDPPILAVAKTGAGSGGATSGNTIIVIVVILVVVAAAFWWFIIKNKKSLPAMPAV